MFGGLVKYHLIKNGDTGGGEMRSDSNTYNTANGILKSTLSWQHIASAIQKKELFKNHGGHVFERI